MRTVEVIEDDPAMRALLLEWLADEGYRVRVHGSSHVAAAWDADAVVVDLSNQQLQGAEAIRHARSRFAPAAVIGLSTRLIHAPAGDCAQARTLGLDELLPKPCSRQTLVAAVARAIEGMR
jgi:CheY-like chemotaxis protein